MEEKRGSWGSNIGFILAAAGSAIGLGNLWKFPYLAGKNGGGAFVLVYLVLVVILGFGLILTEMAIGRRGKSDAFGSFNNIKKGWGFIGIFGILACFIILSYYTVIAGWILKYIVVFFGGGAATTQDSFFGNFISSGTEPLIYTAASIIITGAIVLGGVSGGIEKASKIMMPILLLFMFIIVGRSITLPNAMEGITFFLKPDFSKITGSVVLAALGQVFFSLSLGMGAIVTYGSYLNKDSNLVKNSFIIPALDTLIALLAGLAILPAVFSFGLVPNAGPSLIFITLPKVFEAMPGGVIFGIMFFILVLFAALTSAISLLEVVTAYFVDQLKIKRIYAVIIGSIAIFAVAIPNSNSFGEFGNTLFFGMNFFDLLGYITDNLLLPITGLLSCIFIGYVWNKNEVKKEVTNEGKISFKLFDLWYYSIKFVGVIVLLIILLQAIGILKL